MQSAAVIKGRALGASNWRNRSQDLRSQWSHRPCKQRGPAGQSSKLTEFLRGLPPAHAAGRKLISNFEQNGMRGNERGSKNRGTWRNEGIALLPPPISSASKMFWRRYKSVAPRRARTLPYHRGMDEQQADRHFFFYGRSRSCGGRTSTTKQRTSSSATFSWTASASASDSKIQHVQRSTAARRSTTWRDRH